MSDGSATIKIEIDSSDAKKDINAFVRDFDRRIKAIEARIRPDVDTKPLSNLEARADKASKALRRIAVAIGSGLIVKKLGDASKALGKFAVQSVAAAEQTRIAFEGLFQDTDIAGGFLDDLQEFAASTPFEFNQLTGNAQRLIGTFGVGFRDEVIPTLTAIGNVASTLGASAESVDRVVLAFSQISGAGVVRQEELNQLRDALPGFNANAAIAAEMGISVAEATDLITKGAVDAETGIRALTNAMEDFPGAAGAMERQSQTLNGRISTLRDNIDILTRNSFTGLTDAVGETVDILGDATTSAGPLARAFANIDRAMSAVVRELNPLVGDLINEGAAGFVRLLDSAGPLVVEFTRLARDGIGPLTEILSTLIDTGTIFLQTTGPGMIGVLSTLATTLNAIDPAVLSALLTGFLAFRGVSAATASIEGFSKALSAAGNAKGLTALGGALGTVTKFAGPLGIAATGVGIAYSVLSQRSAEARMEEERLARVIDQATESFNDHLLALGQNNAELERLSRSGGIAAEVLSAINDSFAEIRDLEIRDDAFDAYELADIFGIEVQENVLDEFGNVIEQHTSEFQTLYEAVGEAGLAAFDTYGEALDELGLRQDRYKDGLLELSAAAISAARDGNIANLSRDLFATDEQYENTIEALGFLTTGFDGLADAEPEIQRTVSALLSMGDADTVVSGLVQELGSLEAVARELQTADPVRYGDLVDIAFEDGRVTIEELTGILEQVGADIAAEADANPIEVAVPLSFTAEEIDAEFGQIVEALKGIDIPVIESTEFLDELNNQLDELTGRNVSLIEARSEIEALRDELAGGEFFAEQEGIGVTLDLDFEAGRANEKATRDAIEEIRTLAEAQLASGVDAFEVQLQFDANVREFVDSFVGAGGALSEIQDYLDEYGLVPNFILTGIENAEDSLFAEQFAEFVETLEEDGITDIEAAVIPLIADEDYDGARELLEELTEDRQAEIEATLDASEATDAYDEMRLIFNRNPAIIALEAETSAVYSAIDRLERQPVTIPVRLSPTSGFGGILPPGVSFNEAGSLDITRAASHIISPGQAAAGPYTMVHYGEPSTHGEAFISFAPKHRDRNVEIITEANDRLGNPLGGVGAINVSSSGGSSEVAREVASMRRTFRTFIKAVAQMPPITVQAVGGSPENAAAKMWHENRKRLVAYGG